MIRLRMNASKDGRVSTPCPFGERTDIQHVLVNIGSSICADCKYHVMRSGDVVTCRHPEKLEKAGLFIVTYRDDTGRRSVTSRRFKTRKDAQDYAVSIAPARKPKIYREV